MLNGNGIGNENMDNGILSEHYTPHTEEDESPEVSDRSSYRREYRSGYDARSARYQRSRRGGSSRQQGSSESQGSSFGLLGVQTVICALALLAAFLLSLSKSSVFDQSKVFIAQALSKSVTQQQITQAFDTIKKNLNTSDFFQLSTSSSSSNLGAVSSGSQSAASSKASSSAASSSAAQNASSTAAASSSAASVSNASSSGGKGGEDLDAVFSGSQLVPPKSASLGPLKLTVVPLWPVNGEITSGFGYRINPITKLLSFHTGMDIGANKDTPILAALNGTVEDVGKNEAYGNYILLLHGNGVETFYGHCDSVIKAKGDVVKAGEEIALVGSTGMSTGPHLHFEIRVGGVSYNPQWLLKS